MKFRRHLAPIGVIMSILAGCGGGGASSDTAPAAPSTPISPTTPVGPVVSPGDLQVTVPPYTYSAASQELAFVTALNDFRSHLGLGLLAQNTRLDLASANHLSYVLTNDIANGGSVNLNAIDPVTGRPMYHVESPSLPKFTGVQELERAKYAGYTGTYAGEEVGFGGGQGAAAVLSSLTQTVYHRAGLMSQSVREVGVAVGGDRSQTLVMEIGLKTPQSVGSDYIGVFPFAGQSLTALHAFVEAPNPFAELSTQNSDFPTKTSFPISITIAEGRALGVTSFSVVQAGQTEPLIGRVMIRANDPNQYLGSNTAFWIGNTPLKPATSYSVKFVGTNNAMAFTKEWSFVTK